MSTLSIVLLCIAIYAVIGIIVGITTNSVAKGIFWIFYLLEPIIDGLGDIDLDL